MHVTDDCRSDASRFAEASQQTGGYLMPLYRIGGYSPTVTEAGSTWIAPSADIIGDARLGAKVSVWFGAVIRADNTPIVIGERTNIQDGAMLHSDPGSALTIGNGCTVGHHAVLHGCTLGSNVLVGIGATVLNNAVIADDCLIGAGAVVTEGKLFPRGSLIIGVPAKVHRELNKEEIEGLRASARVYDDKRAMYLSDLTTVSAISEPEREPLA
jgi:carbonic anhydrase/acetyltransferase-like protein (isoleucine patch superfamily)